MIQLVNQTLKTIREELPSRTQSGQVIQTNTEAEKRTNFKRKLEEFLNKIRTIEIDIDKVYEYIDTIE